MANRRTRTRSATPGAVISAAVAGEEQPIANRQDRRRESIVREDLRIERPQRDGVRLIDRRIGDSAAPQDVVGDDQRTRREARDQGVEIALVLRLQRVDEGEIEWPGEGGLIGGERLE